MDGIHYVDMMIHNKYVVSFFKAQVLLHDLCLFVCHQRQLVHMIREWTSRPATTYRRFQSNWSLRHSLTMVIDRLMIITQHDYVSPFLTRLLQMDNPIIDHHPGPPPSTISNALTLIARVGLLVYSFDSHCSPLCTLPQILSNYPRAGFSSASSKFHCDIIIVQVHGEFGKA